MTQKVELWSFLLRRGKRPLFNTYFILTLSLMLTEESKSWQPTGNSITGEKPPPSSNIAEQEITAFNFYFSLVLNKKVSNMDEEVGKINPCDSVTHLK